MGRTRVGLVRRILVVLMVCSSVAGRAYALEPSDRPVADDRPAAVDQVRIDFVTANTVFALLHEFGHAVIRDFRVPLLGLEEDSADTLAAMLLLADGATVRDEVRMPLIDMLALAAIGNALTWKTGIERQETEIVYWAQHSLSVRRATRIACLIYGSDTSRHEWIAAGTEMPDFRRDGCADEHAMARAGAQWVRDRFGRPGTDPSRSGKISVVYGATSRPVHAQVRSFLQERGILEGVAESVDAQFSFPEPLVLRARVCGGPNAYWDPEAREVRLCYELLEAFWQLSADPALARVFRSVSVARAGLKGDP